MRPWKATFFFLFLLSAVSVPAPASADGADVTRIELVDHRIAFDVFGRDWDGHWRVVRNDDAGFIAHHRSTSVKLAVATVPGHTVDEVVATMAGVCRTRKLSIEYARIAGGFEGGRVVTCGVPLADGRFRPYTRSFAVPHPGFRNSTLSMTVSWEDHGRLGLKFVDTLLNSLEPVLD